MWKRVFRRVEEVSYDAAVSKSRAARARHNPPAPDAPAPREVFAEACAAIAERLEPAGFRYARSGPHLTRRHAGLREEIAFGTSHSNIRGVSVSLDLAMNVGADGLRDWRRTHERALSTDDWIAGGILPLLLPDVQNVVWNVADPATRGRVVDDVVDTVEGLVLPWFARFEDPDRLAAELELGTLAAVEPAAAVETLLWLGRRDAAVRYVRSFLAARPDLRADYDESVRELERGDPPWQPTAYAEQLAFVAVAHGVRPD